MCDRCSESREKNLWNHVQCGVGEDWEVVDYYKYKPYGESRFYVLKCKIKWPGKYISRGYS